MTKKNNINVKLVLPILSIVYFISMLRFYLLDYYVPDFRLYYQMHENGYKAKDGFSSLFILISGLAAEQHRLLTVLMLLFMSIGLYCISKYVYSLFGKVNFNFVITETLLYSCGVFYYFYGKVYYDIPFTVVNFGLALIFLDKVKQKEKIDIVWYFLWASIGLLLSWKAYNIFIIAGIGLLILGKEKYRTIVFAIFRKPMQILFSVVSFGLGYLVGNYNLLFYFKETLKGIRAYPAQADIIEFLFTKAEPQWDHVNNMSSNVSVVCFATIVIMMIIIPIAYKKIYYLSVGIFMSLCLYAFITLFSPGFTWHGFTFGLFIVCFVAFELSEIDFKNNIIRYIVIVAVLLQVCINFGFYVPKQISWFNTTNRAIQELENNEEDIYLDTISFLEEIDEGSFCIDQVVKRFAPVKSDGHYEFCDPLKITNYENWKEIETRAGYVDYDYMWSADYVIWIIPKSFSELEGVTRMNFHDEKTVIHKIQKDDYTIYLLKR